MTTNILPVTYGATIHGTSSLSKEGRKFTFSGVNVGANEVAVAVLPIWQHRLTTTTKAYKSDRLQLPAGWEYLNHVVVERGADGDFLKEVIVFAMLTNPVSPAPTSTVFVSLGETEPYTNYPAKPHIHTFGNAKGVASLVLANNTDVHDEYPRWLSYGGRGRKWSNGYDGYPLDNWSPDGTFTPTANWAPLRLIEVFTNHEKVDNTFTPANFTVTKGNVQYTNGFFTLPSNHTSDFYRFVTNAPDGSKLAVANLVIVPYATPSLNIVEPRFGQVVVKNGSRLKVEWASNLQRSGSYQLAYAIKNVSSGMYWDGAQWVESENDNTDFPNPVWNLSSNTSAMVLNDFDIGTASLEVSIVGSDGGSPSDAYSTRFFNLTPGTNFGSNASASPVGSQPVQQKRPNFGASFVTQAENSGMYDIVAGNVRLFDTITGEVVFDVTKNLVGGKPGPSGVLADWVFKSPNDLIDGHRYSIGARMMLTGETWGNFVNVSQFDVTMPYDPKVKPTSGVDKNHLEVFVDGAYNHNATLDIQYSDDGGFSWNHLGWSSFDSDDRSTYDDWTWPGFKRLYRVSAWGTDIFGTFRSAWYYLHKRKRPGTITSRCDDQLKIEATIEDIRSTQYDTGNAVYDLLSGEQQMVAHTAPAAPTKEISLVVKNQDELDALVNILQRGCGVEMWVCGPFESFVKEGAPFVLTGYPESTFTVSDVSKNSSRKRVQFKLSVLEVDAS